MLKETYLHQLRLLRWDQQGYTNNYSAITARRAIAEFGNTVSDSEYSYTVIDIIDGDCYRTMRQAI